MSGIFVCGSSATVAHISTKLSQSVFPIETHILMYWYARCNWAYSYIITSIHVSTKLSQIVFLDPFKTIYR